MQTYKVLILTDHSGHSSENSLYALAHSMRTHDRVQQLDIATRANLLNNFFFKDLSSKELHVSKVDEYFSFHSDGIYYKKNIRNESLRTYDVIWLRMPPPLSGAFLAFLQYHFPNILFINNPEGIFEAGSKAFLMNFKDVCPPMKLCHSLEDIIDFKKQFPIVLKPFREYGGKGIVKIDGDRVWQGKKETNFKSFIQNINKESIEYLGVKYLKKVSEGDKRIIVVNGEILGASLRLPAVDSWLCNVAAGGRSVSATVSPEEKAIVKRIHPTLSKMGIVMYGIDTLVGDDGKRVLSEINTTSIGGVPQLEKQSGKPVVKQTIDLIMKHIIEQDATTYR